MRKAIPVLLVLMLVLAAFVACKQELEPEPHVHSLTKVEAVAATCEAAGNSAYYTCECGKFFSDAEGTTEIEEGSWVIAALGHDFTNPTYDSTLHKTTWTCSHDNSHTSSIVGQVLVTTGTSTTGYETLEAAVAALPENATATIIVNEDISVAETITLENRNITIMNRDGADVTIQDAVTTHVTDTGSTSNQVARMFQISGSSNLVLTGNTTGKLKFQGAASGSDAHTDCARRVLFFMGTAAASRAAGMITINDGVEVTGIYSSGGTSFGSIVRAYGKLTINGGNFHDNYQNGNAMFCIYDDCVVNNGTFSNNSSGGSSSCFQVAGGVATLTVNGGSFTNNTQNYSTIVCTKGTTTTINAGTFTGNKATLANGNAGAAFHCNSDATAVLNILGGTYSNNTNVDNVTRDLYASAKGTVTIGTGVATFVTQAGTYINGVLQTE